MRKSYAGIIAAVTLVLFAVITISAMGHNGPVYDEVSHHIASGYSFLRTRDFRLNSTQPPLIEELSAIPLLFLRPALPLDHPSWVKIDRSTFGFEFLYRYGNDTDKIVFWSRVPVVILSILCGILVFTWASQLYGQRAGILALFLYVFSPNITAYSHLVLSDMGLSFFILLATYRLYKFLIKPKRKNILFMGLALGLAQASKVTALLLIPLFFILCLYRWFRTREKRYITGLGVAYIICYLVVFACYFGEVKPLLENDVDVPEKVAYIEKAVDIISPGNQGLKNRLVWFALHTPIPFATYIMNILSSTNMVFRERIFDVFLMGRHSLTGWWYFYPAVFLFKTPIPIFILLTLSLLYFNRLRPGDRLSEATLISFIIIFILPCLFTRLQGGVRYILPLYPFIFIYISKVVNLKVKRRLYTNVCILGLSLWYMAESIAIYPHYISYFNQFAGGPDNGWRYLRYTNIDYGQDLVSLARYVKENNIDELRLSYSGTADPGYYGIRHKDTTEDDKFIAQDAVYAISVNNIDSFAWAKRRTPTAKAGYSIFIYDARSKM